ncbi:MAG: 1,4-alpha-glucan branching protein [Phycisphaerae bacterium]|nr:1,4-alpha-glucan branching protein [Phycisphaerae bacterium]
MVTIDGDWAVFSFYRPGAKQVYLAGEFNGWRTGDINMFSVGDGNWVAKVRLPAGEFRFRYCADGEWFTDYAACGVEPGRFGMDSLVVIQPRSLKIGPGIQDQPREDNICVA